MIEHHIILMGNDKDRLNHFNSHFSDMINSNEISIFSAITKDTTNFIDIPKENAIKIDRKFRDVATIVKSVVLFHTYFGQNLCSKDIDMAVILEDDSLLIDDYKNELKAEVEELLTIGFVHLFTHPEQSGRKNRYEIPGKVRVLKRIRTWGTVGYLIVKAVFRKFVKIR